MTRDEKIEELLNLTRELFRLNEDGIDEIQIDSLIVQTKVALETYKQLRGE